MEIITGLNVLPKQGCMQKSELYLANDKKTAIKAGWQKCNMHVHRRIRIRQYGKDLEIKMFKGTNELSLLESSNLIFTSTGVHIKGIY